MSAIVQSLIASCIQQDIQQHTAWVGNISGLKAEKMLRGLKRPYTYVLRGGETQIGNETDYYVSFILPDLSIRHQPFVITETADGWYYENGGAGGPYVEAEIEDVLHLMMHCRKDDPSPLRV